MSRPPSRHLVVPADAVVEQLLVQCWMFEARAGRVAEARAHAERTLERLLSRGLPSRAGPGGALLLDPYAANNELKSRAGEPADASFAAWQETTRRNAASLPAAPHRYRLALRREWHVYTTTPGRPVALRLAVPLRGAAPGAPAVEVLEQAGALVDRRDAPGRVELRFDPAVRGPIVAELTVEFTGGELRDPGGPSTPLGAAALPADEPWLRQKEGLLGPSPAVAELAAALSSGAPDARAFTHRAYDHLLRALRFGDVHRGDLAGPDPLASILELGWADCVLGSSLLVALCRARGVPARLLTGYLLHPANVGPHTWAEVKLADDTWVPFDFGAWCYSAGNPADPEWGGFFRGRSDARFVAEVLPRDFTGWGNATPPADWYRLERLTGERIEHTLHALGDGALLRRDLIAIENLGPA